MPLTVTSSKNRSNAKSKPARPNQPHCSDYVIGEINAFIAIRDELLVEAEEAKTKTKLESLIMANNFVESCLIPAQSPYEMQFLPEPDAVRERKRCQKIKQRATSLLDQIEVR
jgi:hypothetical protein